MKNFICPKCRKQMDGVSDMKWQQCPDCKSFINLDKDGNIVRYDYDQVINGQEYVVVGENKHLIVYASEMERDKPILKLDFQEINNQQELEELLPRLLKLKAFV